MRIGRSVVGLLALIAAARTPAGGAVFMSTSTASSPADRDRPDVLFYSDLGPDEIDVGAYSSEQRRNYAVYAHACSRCHGLARSINAPYTGRGWWEFYMSGMSLRGRLAGRPFSREEIKAVLDFLEYDARVRKIEHAAAFEKSTEELKLRFAAVVDQRMSEEQTKPQPQVLP